MRRQKTLIIVVLMAVWLSGSTLAAAPVAISITGTGNNCNSGGAMTPDTVTADPGEQVTINFSTSGTQTIQIHGFNNTTYLVVPGTPTTVSFVATGFQFYGTCPGSTNIKGAGSVVLNQPAPTPPPAPVAEPSVAPEPIPTPSPSPTPTEIDAPPLSPRPSVSPSPSPKPSSSGGSKVWLIGAVALVSAGSIGGGIWLLIKRPKP